MDLGKFSLSIAVKDMTKSLSFYEALGFEVIDGGHTNSGFPDTDSMKWRILESVSLKVGLFQGMFQENIISFNPKDVFSIQNSLKSKGITFTKEAVENEPMKSAVLKDPDGNLIMFDQS